MTATSTELRLSILEETFAACRLPVATDVPNWASLEQSFWCITRTADELSIICDASVVPAEITAERDWRAFKVMGPLDFSLVGILASLTSALAEANISILAISTYDTDYILVREEKLSDAIDALSRLCKVDTATV